MHAHLPGLLELSQAECLRLLADAPFGRIVFTSKAMPAIRPVNHIMDGGAIIIRTRIGTAHRSATGTVVAYEADDIGPAGTPGWSVAVVGRASPLTDELECARYRQVLPSWVTGTRDDIIGIRPDMVDGFRLVPDSGSTEPAPEELFG